MAQVKPVQKEAGCDGIGASNAIDLLPSLQQGKAKPPDKELRDYPLLTKYSKTGAEGPVALQGLCLENPGSTGEPEQDFWGKVYHSEQVEAQAPMGGGYCLSDIGTASISFPVSQSGSTRDLGLLQTLYETIPAEIHALKPSHAAEIAAPHQRGKIEEMVSQIHEWSLGVEKRVSDLEGCSLFWDKELGSLQKKLMISQGEVDDLENYAWRSNVRFVGVPKRIEDSGEYKNISHLVDSLIRSYILEDATPDLTIMRAH
ncbi:hypothetical protein NDU88_005498 [Pleurodeles waltl]|uniref:Uncharacterized protein n=1 Tax=Pleurodeles waltl TaxID=8319 RepID=A0AAV7SLV7_PLEWA|nr:hypothetical protein NDU88_005498 [Pleurodeles waltl]